MSQDDKNERLIGYFVEFTPGWWERSGERAERHPMSGQIYYGSATKEQVEQLTQIVHDFLNGKSAPSAERATNAAPQDSGRVGASQSHDPAVAAPASSARTPDPYIEFFEAWRALNALTWFQDGRNQAERNAAAERLDDAFDAVLKEKKSPASASESLQTPPDVLKRYAAPFRMVGGKDEWVQVRFVSRQHIKDKPTEANPSPMRIILMGDLERVQPHALGGEADREAD